MEDTPRTAVLKHLAALADDLDRFEQTTHGLLFGSADHLGKYISDVLGNPNAYNTSNLAQCLRRVVHGYSG